MIDAVRGHGEVLSISSAMTKTSTGVFDTRSTSLSPTGGENKTNRAEAKRERDNGWTSSERE